MIKLKFFHKKLLIFETFIYISGIIIYINQKLMYRFETYDDYLEHQEEVNKRITWENYYFDLTRESMQYMIDNYADIVDPEEILIERVRKRNQC